MLDRWGVFYVRITAYLNAVLTDRTAKGCHTLCKDNNSEGLGFEPNSATKTRRNYLLLN